MLTEDIFHKTEESLDTFVRFIREGFNQIFQFLCLTFEVFLDFQLRVHVNKQVHFWRLQIKHKLGSLLVQKCDIFQYISRVIQSFTKLLTSTERFTGVSFKLNKVFLWFARRRQTKLYNNQRYVIEKRKKACAD